MLFPVQLLLVRWASVFGTSERPNCVQPIKNMLKRATFYFRTIHNRKQHLNCHLYTFGRNSCVVFLSVGWLLALKLCSGTTMMVIITTWIAIYSWLEWLYLVFSHTSGLLGKHYKESLIGVMLTLNLQKRQRTDEENTLRICEHVRPLACCKGLLGPSEIVKKNII